MINKQSQTTFDECLKEDIDEKESEVSLKNIAESSSYFNFGEKAKDIFAIEKEPISSSHSDQAIKKLHEEKYSSIEIRQINREISRKIPKDQIELLIKEHGFLVKKKFNEGISKQEERRLTYVRWQLERIDEAYKGDYLDRLEIFTEGVEKLASDVNSLLNGLRYTKKARKRYHK